VHHHSWNIVLLVGEPCTIQKVLCCKQANPFVLSPLHEVVDSVCRVLSSSNELLLDCLPCCTCGLFPQLFVLWCLCELPDPSLVNPEFLGNLCARSTQELQF
jgi:hypothetical protein